ncbi:MAG: hypothetical protein ACQGVK_21175 [Myxococcota bacterium]
MDSTGPMTMLRAHFERTRDLDPQAQLQELVDHLEHPEVIYAELVEAVAAVAAAGVPESAPPPGAPPEAAGEEVVLLEHFHTRREITVRDEEPFVFTCMQGRFDPLRSLFVSQPDPEAGDDGFDYVGLIQDRERVGSLGVVQAGPGDTPYTLLMRGLASLAEVLPHEHSQRLNDGVFKGALGDQPIFELHLVMAGRAAAEVESVQGQLTRDLADVILASFAGQTDYTAELASIVSFTMDPDDFHGELDLVWRV